LKAELSSSTWKDKDGTEKSKNFIRGTKIKFLNTGGGKKDEAGKPSAPAAKQDNFAADDDDIPF
jgi:single-stranded DNA-binding protein